MERTLTARESAGLVALATALMAVSYLDRQVFAILSPTITRELVISDAAYGLLAGTFSVAYLVGPPTAGLLLDRVGVRRGLPLAVLVWSVVAGVHAVSAGLVSLFVLRLLLGFAESPSYPGAARVIHQSVSPAARMRAFGFLFTGSSLGAVIAPPLATRLAAAFGWRFAFIGTAIAGLLWIPAWLIYTSRRSVRASLDAPTVDTADEEQGTVVDALRQPALWRAIAATVAMSAPAAFVLLWSAKLLFTRFGVPQKNVGDLLWIPALLFDLGAVIFGDLASRFRERGPVVVKSLFAIGALLATFTGAIVFVETPIAVALLMGAVMAGVGAVSAINAATLVSRIPKSMVAVTTGISAAAQSATYIVASAAIGRVVSGSGGYDAALIGLTVWAIPGALIWLAWPENTLALAAPGLDHAPAKAGDVPSGKRAGE